MKNYFSFFVLLFVIFPSRHGDGFPKANGEGFVSTESLAKPYTIDLYPGIVNTDRPVKAGLLYDVNQNKIVWQKGLHISLPIASLTKIMTVLLVLEDIDQNKVCWDTPVPATVEASLIPSSKIWMKPGQVFSIEDLIKSAMISSANDACYLLGQFCSGTEKDFVKRMNEKAGLLGMYNTYFSNTTGLPVGKYEIDNFSSPHDLLILARAAMKYPELISISSRNDEIVLSEKEKINLKNHNKLALEYSDVDGLKTGYTRKAGFCIVATAQKDSSRVIGIVLGAISPLERNKFVAEMFNKYYDTVLCMDEMEKHPVQNQKVKN